MRMRHVHVHAGGGACAMCMCMCAHVMLYMHVLRRRGKLSSGCPVHKRSHRGLAVIVAGLFVSLFALFITTIVD